MLHAAIPLPLQLVIDDVGWWSGRDGSAEGEPYRTGIARDHTVADYRALARLGRELNMRPQAVFIAAEWDRKNRLRGLPSSQWMGKAWDNSKWVGPWLDEAADMLRANSAHIEIALHSLAHEYWHAPNQFTRAAFYDRQGRLRDHGEVERHLDLYAAILDDNRLGGFPVSYAPCAGLHMFGEGERGLCAMLHKRGVRYMCEPFFVMARVATTQWPSVGVDAGVLMLDRNADHTRAWYTINATPIAEPPGPVCGLHWPNFLHHDPARNDETIGRWVAWLRKFNDRFERELSPSTADCWTQAVYNAGTIVKPEGEGVSLNFADVDTLPASALGDEFNLKIRAGRDTQFTAAGVTIAADSHNPTGGFRKLRLRRIKGVNKATITPRR